MSKKSTETAGRHKSNFTDRLLRRDARKPRAHEQVTRTKLYKILMKEIKGGRSDEKLEALLIQHNVDLSVVDPQGTLLKYAVNKDLTDVIQVLVNNDSAMEVCEDDGLSVLHIAAKRKPLDMFKLLLESKKANINLQTLYEMRTVLQFAVHRNHKKLLSLCLTRGADPNSQDIYGSTALHLAARLGHAQLLEELLEHKSQINLFDNEGWTALHYASEAGHQNCVRMLLQNHAYVDAQSRYGRTSLHWAAERRHISVVQELLNFKANVLIRDLSDRTAVDCVTGTLAQKLLQSYIPATSKQSEPLEKHVSIDYHTNSSSLRDLSLVQINTNDLNFEPRSIGTGAMNDEHSKASRNRSKSMMYMLEEDENFTEDNPRTRIYSIDNHLDTVASQSGLISSGKGKLPKVTRERAARLRVELGEKAASDTSFQPVDLEAMPVAESPPPLNGNSPNQFAQSSLASYSQNEFAQSLQNIYKNKDDVQKQKVNKSKSLEILTFQDSYSRNQKEFVTCHSIPEIESTSPCDYRLSSQGEIFPIIEEQAFTEQCTDSKQTSSQSSHIDTPNEPITSLDEPDFTTLDPNRNFDKTNQNYPVKSSAPPATADTNKVFNKKTSPDLDTVPNGKHEPEGVEGTYNSENKRDSHLVTLLESVDEIVGDSVDDLLTRLSQAFASLEQARNDLYQPVQDSSNRDQVLNGLDENLKGIVLKLQKLKHTVDKELKDI